MTTAWIGKDYHIKPFDLACTSDAATLFNLGKQMRVGDDPGGRAILKADTIIIATAKVYGATTFYSGDKPCRELAKKVMNAVDLPDPRPPLFQTE